MRIDGWTLGLQTVNVLVLAWLLGRFFWRPVAGMIAQRRAEAQRILAEAQAQRQAAEAAAADIARTRAGFAQERNAILAAARDAADRESAARRAAAERAACAITAAAEAAAKAEQAAAAKAWTLRASRLAVEIAARLAGRLKGPAVTAAFLDWLLEAIRALPETARQALAAEGVAIEAVSATELAPDEAARVRGALAAAIGTAPALGFRTDPTLIAGLELRSPHLVIGNSWRADLDTILSEILHDDAL